VTVSELRFEVEDGHEPSVQCWKLPEAAALRLIQLTGEYLRGFALLYGIQSFIDLFVLNVATRLRWRMSLIVFSSCQRPDATFQPNSNSSRHISVVLYVVAMD
jgi:hypothetical protein